MGEGTEDAGQTAWLGGRGSRRRFDDLYNLVCDPAFLVVAWQRVAGNTGARTPGIDRATVAAIESRIGVEEFLHGVREQLQARTFTPVEVRQVMIPKASGKLRALGIPTVTDRVVQAVLDWCWNRFSRPASSRARTGSGRTGARRTRSPRSITSPPRATAGWEADIEACFDRIDHAALMGRVRARIGDKRVLGLVEAFLKSGVMTTIGTRSDHTGTPQGGILSPLLANIALSVLDDHFIQEWDQQMATESTGSAANDMGRPTTAWSGTPTTSSSWSPGNGSTPTSWKRRWRPCWPRWGCGCHRRRPAWSTSTTGSTSSASTSEGCADGQ